jgi:hypothetical protein
MNRYIEDSYASNQPPNYNGRIQAKPPHPGQLQFGNMHSRSAESFPRPGEEATHNQKNVRKDLLARFYTQYDPAMLTRVTMF